MLFFEVTDIGYISSMKMMHFRCVLEHRSFHVLVLFVICIKITHICLFFNP